MLPENIQGVEMKTEKLEKVEFINGTFAVCPRCNKVMAHNVMGYWVCLFGCGLRVKEEIA